MDQGQNMDEEQILRDYLRITRGHLPEDYPGSEEQGKRIQRFSLLRSCNLEYEFSSVEPSGTM